MPPEERQAAEKRAEGKLRIRLRFQSSRRVAQNKWRVRSTTSCTANSNACSIAIHISRAVLRIPGLISSRLLKCLVDLLCAHGGLDFVVTCSYIHSGCHASKS